VPEKQITKNNAETVHHKRIDNKAEHIKTNHGQHRTSLDNEIVKKVEDNNSTHCSIKTVIQSLKIKLHSNHAHQLKNKPLEG